MFSRLVSIYQFFWMLESHSEQRLAWRDAEEARIARLRAEQAASKQFQEMLEANPSGQLGNSKLDDIQKLKKSGLL